jgi:hypothetical protein
MIEPITDEMKARRKAEWNAWAADPRRITPPFTDAAIALLTAAEDDRRGGGIHVGKEIGPCDDYDGVMARDVRALAAEVQQSRALLAALRAGIEYQDGEYDEDVVNRVQALLS